MANVEPPKQSRRKRRWGDGPTASEESPARKARLPPDGPSQPHAAAPPPPPPPPPASAAPPPADPKARAAALQASIQARLAALRARTSAASSSAAPRPAGKRDAVSAPPSADDAARPGKKARVFELDMSSTASTRLAEKREREERIRGGAKDDKPKVKKFVNPYLAHAEGDDDDDSGDRKGKGKGKKKKRAGEEEVLLDARLAGGQVARARPRTRPINFVAPGTYVALGEKKREAALRAEESGYVSGRKAGNVVVSVGMGGAEDAFTPRGDGDAAGEGDGHYGAAEAGRLLPEVFPARADAPELELEDHAARKKILTSIGDVDLELNDEAVAAASGAASGGLMPYAMEWWDAELLPSKLRKELAAEEKRGLALRTRNRIGGQRAGNKSGDDDGDGTPAERLAAGSARQAGLVERCYKNASLGHSRTSSLVQHPVPVLTPAQRAALAAAKEKAPTIHLTKAERKRHRKLRRAERLREQQDLQAAGLVPPPEPRLTLSNYMKVLGDQAVLDPSRMESRVMEQIQARKMKHEKMNADRKLTKEQKAEKHRRKLAEDTSTGVHVALFWVADMGHPYHRAKVDLNAGQNSITGGVLECAEEVNGTRVNLVVAEGGERAIKRYTRLMTVRMRWRGEDFYEDEEEEGGEGGGDAQNAEEDFERLDDVDGPPDGGEAGEKRERKRFNPNNECKLVWTGMAMKRSFANFMFQSAATPTLARRVMEAKGVPHYWDRAVAYAEGRDGTGGEGGGLGFRLG